MKTSTIFLSAVVLLAAIGFTSCKKGNDKKSNTELITQKAWKIQNYGLDENNDGIIQDTESDMASCESDDTFTFNTDGSGIYASGTVKCSAYDPATLDITWSFASNETELVLSGESEKINKLDENTLETYYDDVNSQGQPVKYIRTFIH